jgi:hypothetical protein
MDVDEAPWGWPLRHKEHHIPVADLERMRDQTDSTADAFLELLIEQHPDVSTCPPTRIIEYLEKEMANPLTQDKRAQRFWTSVRKQPSWLQPELLVDGQTVFLKYSTSSAMGLMYFSLIGGFSAPKIVKVLDETGYLTKTSPDVTWRRLNETFSMVIACLLEDDALHVGKKGWLHVLSVRLLHSRVRRRIMSSNKGGWDMKTYGVPINQEDMLGTLLSFSINVIETIERIGAPFLTNYEIEAYLHLWRYIGYIIGVDEENNKCLSVHVARGAVESIIMHLLHPDARSRQVANNVINGICNRPPLKWSMALHSEVARHLLHDPLADALALKRGSVWVWLYAKYVMICLYLIAVCFAPFVTRTSQRGRKLIHKIRVSLKTVCDKALLDNKESDKEKDYTQVSTGACPLYS